MEKTIIDLLYEILNPFIIENNLKIDQISIEKTKNIEWGDYSTNIALILSKYLKKDPINIANEISQKIKSDLIREVNVTKPGFINIFLSNHFYNNLLFDAIKNGKNFSQFNKKEIIYNIEYVSANPTGSLHIGHARNAALGSTLANVWEKFGITVDREYYINDGGAQINKLGVAVLIRYKQLFNINDELPEDSYHGEEPKIVANELKKIYKDKFINSKYDNLSIIDEEDKKIINDFSKKLLMEKIKKTLENFRARFDIFFPESKIFEEKLIDKSLEVLKKHLFEKDGALWLRTTDFGDDKDRVLIKSDKNNTYFLPDISYHFVKLSRKNYEKIFDIFGSDHGSYATRIKAACECFGYRKKLEVIIMQMVKLTKDNKPFKMSKRSGQSLTLNDLIESIGVDASRWYLVSQSPNSHLEIDVDKVKKSDSSNPMYYVMYAHARISQIILKNNSYSQNPIDVSKLNLPKERELMNLISYYPYLISKIAKTYEVHSLNSFLLKLASNFHSYYSEIKIITDDKENSNQKINLIKAIQAVIASGLKILEIEALEKI